MSFKMRILSAALAASAVIGSGAAFATINDGVGAGNIGELYLVVYDANSNNSWTYVRDLGISYSGLQALTANGSYGATTGLTAFGAAGGQSDTFWSGFTTATAGDKLTYGVFVNNNGANNGYASTVAAGSSTSAQIVSAVTAGGSNAIVGNGLSAVANFAGATNGLDNNPAANSFNDMGALGTPSINGAAYHKSTGSTDTADAAGLQFGLASGSVDKGGFTTFGDIGSNLSLLNAKGGAKGAAPVYTVSAGTFLLSTSGDLTYNIGPIGAVPEPGTWALLGAGLLTLGAVARRRMNG